MLGRIVVQCAWSPGGDTTAVRVRVEALKPQRARVLVNVWGSYTALGAGERHGYFEQWRVELVRRTGAWTAERADQLWAS